MVHYVLTPNSFEAQNKLLNSIPENHQPIFRFMAEYGTRPSEARALKHDCINDNEIIIKCAFSKTTLRETTKTGKIRHCPMTTYMREVLSSIKNTHLDFVFVNARGRPYSNQMLNKIWHKACSEHGIKIKMYNGLRHSLGSQLAESGKDINIIRQILGHSDIRMTLRYAKDSKKVIEETLINRRKVVSIEHANKLRGRN